jgi:ankyrin repeat protein
MRSGRFDSLIEERIRRSSEAVRAAKFCDFRTFEDLIKDGSDVFALDGNGELPLAWAVRSNCSEIANKLLNLGADFEQPEGNGLSPLDWAKKERNFEMITLFHEDTYSGTL